MKRTPPRPQRNQNTSQSDNSTLPNPASEVDNISTPNNMTQRHKRPRPEDSPTKTDFENFKDEITTMFISWQEEQNTNIKKLIADMAEIKIQNSCIQKTNSDIETSIQFLSTQFDDVNKKIQVIEADLEQYQQKITFLEERVEEHERKLVMNRLEIRNVPHTNRETQEELIKVSLDTFKAINTDINSSDIQDIRRLPGKPEMKKPIIVTLNTSTKKNNIIKAARTYNQANKCNKLNSAMVGIEGPSVPIYIAELLTAKARKLYFQCRELVRNGHFKYCWTANGSVLLRKEDGAQPISIKDEQQIIDLKKKLSV